MENENKTNEETKQGSNEQSGASNINYNVKMPKQKSNTPVLICLIIVILALIGIIVCLVIMNLQNIKVNNIASDNKNQIEQNTNKDVANNTNNSTQNVEQKTTEQKIADAYKKYTYITWSSKSIEKYKTFDIKDNKLYRIKYEYDSENQKDKIANLKEIYFDKGTIKYIKNLMGGGVISGVAIVTQEGEAYIGILEHGYLGSPLDSDFENLKFEKVNINEKIIDMGYETYFTQPSYYPYFLTENGKLYDKDGKTFENINGIHIARRGVPGRGDAVSYFNNDGTIEISFSTSTKLSEYVNIYGLFSDGSDNTIYVKNIDMSKFKAKMMFGWYDAGGDYVIAENNELFKFSLNTKYIANKTSIIENKTINNIDYNSDTRVLTIEFTDGEKVNKENAYCYKLN